MATLYPPSSKRPSQRANANDSSAIYVGNLSFNTAEDDLGAFFNDQCGNVQRVRIIYDNNTRQSRGFGFVYFNTTEAFNSALKLHGCQLDGRHLRISPAEDRNSSSSSSSTTVSQTTTSKSKTYVVHCKKSSYDVYIGRPSDWGNPFVIGKDGDRADVIRKYRQWIMARPDLISRAKSELRGRRIACWCKPEDCHGDVLAEIADAD